MRYNKKMNPIFKKIITIAIIVVGALSWVFVAVRIYELRSQRNLPWRSYLGYHHRQPVGVGDVAYISPWMTFDYITKIFHLPSTYLEQTLQIHDSKYPLITISQYAKKTNTNTSLLIEKLQTAVKNYLASSTPQ